MSVTSKDTAEHYKWGDGCDGWHLAKTEALSVIQERVPPGRGEIRHYHTRANQFFYVLSGTATITRDGETFTLAANEGLSVPAGAVHELHNESDEDLEFLVTSTPPSHGDRVIV